MSDFAEMLDNNMDLDTRIQIAGDMVKQAAEEEGVDISSFSQEELGDMIGGLVDSMEPANDNGKTASEAQQGAQLTYADVALELNKRAAAEGVDLSQLDPAQFNEAFDKIAAELSDPEYAEEVQKVAAQEQQMDHYGRVAARGFVDEINKLAAEEEDEDDDEKKEKVAGKAKELASKAFGATKAFGKRVGEGAKAKEKSFSEHIGRRTPGGTKGPMTQEHATSRGRKILAGVGGGAAAAGGGAAAYHHKKASIQDVAGAIDTLRAAGYDI